MGLRNIKGLRDLRRSFLGGGGGAPFPTDLIFDFNSRALGTNEIKDAVSGDIAEVVGGYEAIVATTATLPFTDLTGVTIVEYEGTTLPVIVGNDVTFTAGVYQHLLLSNGDEFYFNNHLRNSLTNELFAGVGFAFQLLNTGILPNTTLGLSKGFYQIGDIELAKNGTFEYNGLHWGKTGESTVDTGVGRILSTAGALSWISQDNVFKIGEVYEVSYWLDVAVAGFMLNNIGTFNWSVNHGFNTQILTATEVNLSFKRGSIIDVSMTNVSVKKYVPNQVINPKFNYSNRAVTIGILGDSTIEPVAQYIYNQNIIIETDISTGGDDINDQLIKWNALPNYSDLEYVFIEIGLNNLIPGESTASILVEYQNLIDTINADAPTAKIILSTMTPCYTYLFNTFSLVGANARYQVWLDVNNSIRGQFTTNLTGNYSYVDTHTAIMDDGTGRMLPKYDDGGGLHQSAAGSTVIAKAWDDKIVSYVPNQELVKDKVHNLIYSFIRFPVGQMDRSIAFGMFNNLSRSSIYYNDQDTRLHHISELPYDNLQLTLEAIWLDRIFSGYNVNYGDKTELFEVFGYNTPKENDNLIKVLNYCNYIFP